MDATQFFIQFSSNYPSIANFTKLIAVFMGGVGLGWVLWMAYRLEVAQTIDRSQFGMPKLVMAALFSSLLVSLGWTLNIVGNSAFDYGGYILEAYEGTAEWRARSSTDHNRVMKEFFIATSKLFGLFLGVWGLSTCLFACTPNSEQKISAGLIRLIFGAAFFDPVAALDLFGGYGTKYLAVD